MKFTDESLTIRDIQQGDVIIQDGRHFIVVKVCSDFGADKYGYMNIETGVVLSAQFNSPTEMFDVCFAPFAYETKIRIIKEVVLTNP